MIGTYRFYQDGVLIGESKNLLTTEGKRQILKALAGYAGNPGGSIVLGIFNTAAAVSDLTLAFDSARVPVKLITPDYVNTTIIYKGTWSDPVAGVIYEAGMRSTSGNQNSLFPSKMLVSFDQNSGTWSAGTWATGAARVGADSLLLSPSASTTTTAVKSDLFIDLSGYSANDLFKLAYNVGNANTQNVKIMFYTDASNYYTYTIATPTAGYKVQTFNVSNLVATGTPNLANITQVGVSATATAGGAAAVQFDALRIDDLDTYSETDVLVSRTVLAAPVTKIANVPMEIEYTLDLTLSEQLFLG